MSHSFAMNCVPVVTATRYALKSYWHGGAVAYLLHQLDAGRYSSRWRSGSGVVGWGFRLMLGDIGRQQVFGS